MEKKKALQTYFCGYGKLDMQISQQRRYNHSCTILQLMFFNLPCANILCIVQKCMLQIWKQANDSQQGVQSQSPLTYSIRKARDLFPFPYRYHSRDQEAASSSNSLAFCLISLSSTILSLSLEPGLQDKKLWDVIQWSNRWLIGISQPVSLQK